MFIAFLVQWQLHNHFSFDNIFLWPKRIGRGKGTVHVKSFPYIEQFLPHGILNLGHIFRNKLTKLGDAIAISKSETATGAHCSNC